MFVCDPARITASFRIGPYGHVGSLHMVPCATDAQSGRGEGRIRSPLKFRCPCITDAHCEVESKVELNERRSVSDVEKVHPCGLGNMFFPIREKSSGSVSSSPPSLPP